MKMKIVYLQQPLPILLIVSKQPIHSALPILKIKKIP